MLCSLTARALLLRHYASSGGCLVSVRTQATAPLAPASVTQPFRDKLGSVMKAYEEYIGIADVTAAQNRVIEAEAQFLRAQAQRRDMQLNISHVQAKLKDLHAEIAKTSRGEDRYLSLVTEEHRVLREESRLLAEYRILEKAEQDLFSALSNAVRTSHEKERAQAEKTKYWSIIGSAVGACIGIVGTSINNWLKMRELRRLVARSSETPDRLQQHVATLTSSVESQQNEVKRAMQAIQELFSSDGSAALVATVSNQQSAASQAQLLAERFAEEVRSQLGRLERRSAAAEAAGLQLDQPPDSEHLQLLLSEHERRVERRLIRASSTVALAGVLCGALLAAVLSRTFSG